MPGNVFRVANDFKTNVFLMVQWEPGTDFSLGKLSNVFVTFLDLDSHLPTKFMTNAPKSDFIVIYLKEYLYKANYSTPCKQFNK